MSGFQQFCKWFRGKDFTLDLGKGFGLRLSREWNADETGYLSLSISRYTEFAAWPVYEGARLTVGEHAPSTWRDAEPSPNGGQTQFLYCWGVPRVFDFSIYCID